jgi:F-type H+-transporting ATPase subunit d
VLKNKAIVDEAEKLLKDFKPVTYDVSSTIKAIEAFEAKAVGVETNVGPGEKFL